MNKRRENPKGFENETKIRKSTNRIIKMEMRMRE
jgi:hypothetical protein